MLNMSVHNLRCNSLSPLLYTSVLMTLCPSTGQSSPRMSLYASVGSRSDTCSSDSATCDDVRSCTTPAPWFAYPYSRYATPTPPHTVGHTPRSSSSSFQVLHTFHQPSHQPSPPHVQASRADVLRGLLAASTASCDDLQQHSVKGVSARHSFVRRSSSGQVSIQHTVQWQGRPVR